MLKISHEQTINLIQIGFLDFDAIIDKGIILMGNCKAGKTTTAHYLNHQRLEAGYDQTKTLVYKLSSTNKRQYLDAKIGNSPSRYQTIIPNIFEINDQREGKIILIDQPGYVDSTSCSKIISNKFFHAQIFSKVKNVKFVVVFSYFDMMRRGDNMRQAFKHFLGGFNNIDEIEQQLIQATSVIITGVPKKLNQEQALQIYQNSAMLTGPNSSTYTQLKNRLLTKNRVHIFWSPQKQHEICDINNRILQKINETTKYWGRQLINNQINMKNINTNVLSYFNGNQQLQEEFLKELQQFCRSFKAKFRKSMRGLGKVLGLFVGEDVGNSDGIGFLSQIIKIAEQNSKQNKQTDTYFQLPQKYKQKQATQKQKQLGVILSNWWITQQNNLPIWLLKLKIIQQIQKQIQILCHQPETQTYEYCQRIYHHLQFISIHIFTLATTILPKQFSVTKNKKKQLVLSYLYDILKDVQILGYLNKLMRGKVFGQIQVYKYDILFILQDYIISLRVLFLNFGSENSVENMFLQKCNGANLTTTTSFSVSLPANVQKEVTEFLQQIRNRCLRNEELWKSEDEKNKFKVASDKHIDYFRQSNTYRVVTSNRRFG